MDEGDILSAGIMGMRIHGIRFSVGGPSGMCNAATSFDILTFYKILKSRDLPLAFINIQFSVFADQGEACAVIASVFESVQALNKNRIGISVSHITNDSTHSFFNL